ncbi:MAG TPA: SGNH/GDSL hydrolase family protein [Fimbriimonadaceae bacterium]|nr:SGNH/GDSL hydrolase family protein [Fimbriimonadaceae bacterium]
MRIVFQGDSITDCGRDRSDLSSLGNGYVRLVANALGGTNEYINQGVSGNRIYDLEARWSKDCLDHKPDLVMLLIGINDTWRKFDSNVDSPVEEFEPALERICRQVVESGSKLILLEPFVLPIPPDRVKWRVDLDPRIHAVRRVAAKHADAYVPLDGLFAAATCQHDIADLAADGVHPEEAGHRLIADHLLGAINQIFQT